MKKRLIGMATAIVMSFSSFGVTQVLADGPALTYERAEEECDRMNWYFNNGQYLETIAVADDLLQNYTLDDWHKKVVTEYKYSAQTAYNEYLRKSQRYTYRVSDWGMNVAYRADMSVTEYYDWLEFEMPYPLSLNSYMWLESGTLDEYGVKNSKQLVDEWVAYNSTPWYDSEYGENFEVLSSNYVNVSGFNAYQAVCRHTSYTNRYWTEGEHVIVKVLAFQYGDWLYVFCAEEETYNWSDDFWDAMETVINGISFS